MFLCVSVSFPYMNFLNGNNKKIKKIKNFDTFDSLINLEAVYIFVCISELFLIGTF